MGDELNYSRVINKFLYNLLDHQGTLVGLHVSKIGQKVEKYAHFWEKIEFSVNF